MKIIKMLRARLLPVARKQRIVLAMDVAALHMGIDVLWAIRKSGFSLLLIPALMTSVLAPLDTHVFSIYKCILREMCDEARSEV